MIFTAHMAEAYSEEIKMVDISRVKLMSKMAHYDQKVSEEDLRICGYFKKDYVSFKTWTTAIWITIAYAIIVIGGLFCYIDKFLKSLTVQKLLIVAIVIVAVYIIMLITYCICANKFYKKKYARAKKHIIKYYKQIVRLQKINAKEKRKI